MAKGNRAGGAEAVISKCGRGRPNRTFSNAFHPKVPYNEADSN